MKLSANTINLNETVTAELTEHGHQIMKEVVYDLNAQMYSLGVEPFDYLHKLTRNENGHYVYTTQLWVIMKYFGQHMGLGKEGPMVMTLKREGYIDDPESNN